MKVKRYYLAIAFLSSLLAPLPSEASDWRNNDVSPGQFGPNALPIPDMLDGTIKSDLHIELSADYFQSFKGDQCINPFAKITVPIYPSWVNLTVWMPIVEFYRNCSNTHLRPKTNLANLSGREYGDVYISTDMQVLKQRKYRPDITLRVGLKTASGGSYEYARYTDSPGYFFDLSVAKSIFFDHPFWQELRFAGSAGFLCGQVGDALQNDAYMYGLQAKLKTRYAIASATWGGYTGWIRNGDAPMSIKTEVRGTIKRFEPFVGYQYGLRDFPYHQFRIGLAYNVELWFLNKKK